MIVLFLVLLVIFTRAEPFGSGCDIEINENSPNVYHSKPFNLNRTMLTNVKQMEVLQYKELFTIDSNQVILQTIQKIDREQLCKQHQSCDCFEPVCLLKITILIIYLTFTNNPPFNIMANVCIQDFNDNQPLFPESTQSLDINENSEAGTIYDLQSATDLDSEQFGINRYFINCPFELLNLSFTISKHGSRRSDHQVHVILTIKAVYQSDQRICNLSACDIDFCTTIKLVIRINDINNHRPQWKETIFSRHIREDILPDTIIDRFEAIDQDPVYGKVSYSLGRTVLLSDPKSLAMGIFAIDTSSGELRINKPLDYEDASYRKFELIIIAKDNGTPILSSSATVQITVDNVNDNPPNIRLNKAVIDVKENSDPKYLDFFTVTDHDDMDLDKISCQVTDPENTFHLKKSIVLSPIIFEIHSLRSFDYEKETAIVAVIKCEDGSVPVLSSVNRITINIADVNDNIVHFPQKTINAYISENSPIGTEIVKLHAIDLDRKSSLIYSLSDPTNCSYINIDPYHGYLTTNELLDREAADLYIFRVKVEEKDVHNYSDVVEIYLRITDTNDNSPYFTTQYTFSVPENTTINTIIGQIYAFDPDLGSNGTITYYQSTLSSKGPEYFRVGTNGEIRLFQQLDFETQSIHNLVIAARDHGNTISLSSSTSVIIKVIDSNDHPPRFDERIVSLNLLCVSQEVGKDLISVSDKDQSPENTLINYEIEKIEPSRFRTMFHINQTNGFITLVATKEQCDFKFSSRDKVDITLKIYDPTKVEFKDRANVVINLEIERYDKQILERKVGKNDGSTNWLTKVMQRPTQGNIDGLNRSDDFVDQNVIIVMILIFITIFLGVILVSLVCFIKRRRQAEEEQDVAEGRGIMREKVVSPIQSSTLQYGKNSEFFNFTMKNASATDGYYPTMSDKARSKSNENTLVSDSLKKSEKKIDSNLRQYESTNVKDLNAYQTLVMNPRTSENYSMMESFIINSRLGIRDKNPTDFINNHTTTHDNFGNKPYVSVSFV